MVISNQIVSSASNASLNSLDVSFSDSLLKASKEKKAQTSPLKSRAIQDADGDGLYSVGDFKSTYRMPTSKQLSSDLSKEIGLGTRSVVIMGEAHGQFASDFAFETAKKSNQELKKIGKKLIVAHETPTTPKLDKLINQFYRGAISEKEFLDKGSSEMYNNYTNFPQKVKPTKDSPNADLGYFRQRLVDDVVRFKNAGVEVRFVDGGRLSTDPKESREATMANGILKIAKEPNTVVFAELGFLHAAEKESLPVSHKSPHIWKNAITKPMDFDNPAAKRIASVLGGDKVLTFALDEYFEEGKNSGLTILSGEIERIDYKIDKKDGSVLPTIKHGILDLILPVYDEKTYNDPNKKLSS
jgi:hypothetical protein